MTIFNFIFTIQEVYNNKTEMKRPGEANKRSYDVLLQQNNESSGSIKKVTI